MTAYANVYTMPNGKTWVGQIRADRLLVDHRQIVSPPGMKRIYALRIYPKFERKQP